MQHEYYFVYIMANKTNTTLYTGVTGNLPRRIYEHKEKITKGFTARYNINKLIYFEPFDSIEEAIKREKQIKGGSRQKKIELIEKDNPNWKDLYDNLF
ncbi:MAG: GIY-YIG nuclease family protein [Patescibacteria group bacterium]|nr:GIY-YIG nuclease family protein [Patescibacteria group bacterium]MDD5490520.1 GIY-YIG nuclease family protein [Patescibacteria group bacterium]